MNHPLRPVGLAISMSLLLAAPHALAQEPEDGKPQSVEVTVEKVVSEAAQAAQQAATEIVTQVQRVAEQAVQKAQAAADEVAKEATKSAQQVTGSLDSGYNLLLSAMPVPPALDAQLKLDGKGVLVDNVTADGPAAKAGIQTHDVLIAVNDQPIASTKELQSAVRASAGKELKIKLLRGGESIEVNVTPAKLSASASITFDARPKLNLPSEEIDVEIRKLEGKIREKLKDAGMDVRMQIARPGQLLPPNTFVVKDKIPDDYSITITKRGESPARIEISQGDNKWSANEDELDTLPEKVRPYARRMLGKLAAPAIALDAPGVTIKLPPGVVPPHDFVVGIRGEAERVRKKAEQMRDEASQHRERIERELKHSLRGTVERRLDMMSREMERLSRQMEDLRQQLRADAEQQENEEVEIEIEIEQDQP